MTFDFNIHKYDDQELKSLFFESGKRLNINLYEDYRDETIMKCKQNLQNTLINQQPQRKLEIIEFLNHASGRLTESNKNTTLDQQAFITLQPYPQKNTGINSNGVFLKPVEKGILNPNVKHTTSQIINIDSQYRETILPYDL